MPADVTILYQGGSGGFALFYYLLLSDKYCTGIDYHDPQELIDKQFPLWLKQNPAFWKKQEFWPNNDYCQTKTGKPRLYLICNPCWSPATLNHNLKISANTTKYLLWTDIHTQLRMSWHKRAYWFTEISKVRFSAPANEKHYIKQILRSAISNKDPLLDDIIRQFRPNHTVMLQDFLQNRRLPDMAPPNQRQHAFLDHWLALQPSKAIKHLL